MLTVLCIPCSIKYDENLPARNCNCTTHHFAKTQKTDDAPPLCSGLPYIIALVALEALTCAGVKFGGIETCQLESGILRLVAYQRCFSKGCRKDGH